MDHDQPSIQIRRVPESELESMIELYVDLFADREPLTQCIGFGRERMRDVARAMYSGSDTHVLSQGFCWVARDTEKFGHAVGLIVCDDPAAPGAQRIPDNLSEGEMAMVGAVASLLEQLREPVKDRLTSGVGACLHVAAIGVAPGYEGMGIATRLLQTALQEARERKFRFAFAECTGSASRKIHDKAGFESLADLSVNRLLIDGRLPFAGSQVDVHLMGRTIEGIDRASNPTT